MIVISCLSSIPSSTNYINSNISNDFSLSNRLHSCKSVAEIKQIHSIITKTSLSLHTHQFLYSKILSLCASFSPHSDLSYIYTLFLQVLDPDISVYNDVIRCFALSRNKRSSLIALLVYRGLVENGLVGNSYTYPFVFRACGELLALREGQMVHASVTKNGFVLDLYVVNTLMRFYGVCGRVLDVQKVFDESPEQDLISWTTLIQAFVDNGFPLEGVKVFFDMCEMGMKADEKVMTVVISACARLGDLSLGKKLHDYIYNCKGVIFDVFVGNALVDMYLKCGDVELAFLVFKQMPVRNVVSWNSMILGLVQSGKYKEALSMFRKMREEKVYPDEITLVGVLNSCANLGVIELGNWVHAYVDKNQIDVDGHVGNALIDMYAKCGSIDDALRVFEGMKQRDVYTYSSLIMGLATHGKGELALMFFYEMCERGIQPDAVTFIGVLTACCHSGFVDEGQKQFANMSRLYNIEPQKEHYGCMVDLLGRAGLTTEAYEFVKNMPIEPDKLLWGSLLGACKIHEKLELAKKVMKELVNIEPRDDGAHVLMSNIYASQKKWKNVYQLRKGMKESKLRKAPGCSSIELDGVVYEFQKEDKSHPESKEIYTLLDMMRHHLCEIEHVVDGDLCFYEP